MGANSSNSLESMLGQYATPMPDIAKKYQQNITKGGFLDMPSFSELFGSYKALGEREAQRQSAQATEAFGSQGARYSSDMLGARGGIYNDMYKNLMAQAAQQQLGLRQQQGQEVAALANMQFGANEAGMNRFFQDFLRRTSPPPMYGAAANLSGQYGMPNPIL